MLKPTNRSISPSGVWTRAQWARAPGPSTKYRKAVRVNAKGSGNVVIETNQKRRYLSILPPFFSRSTHLEEFGEGVWGLVQPLKVLNGKPDVRLRMVVARLEDGTLALVGPVAPSEEALDLIKGLGSSVGHIIVPNTSPEHYIYAPAMANAFPQATVWTPAGFFQGRGLPFPGRGLMFANTRKTHPCFELGVDPLPVLNNPDSANFGRPLFEAITFEVPILIEIGIYFPQQRSLVMADSAICLSDTDPEYSNMSEFNVKLAMRLEVWNRLGTLTKPVYQKYPEAGASWVRRVIETCEERGGLAQILPLHGAIPAHGEDDLNGETAMDLLKSCFDFIQ